MPLKTKKSNHSGWKKRCIYVFPKINSVKWYANYFTQDWTQITYSISYDANLHTKLLVSSIPTNINSCKQLCSFKYSYQIVIICRSIWPIHWIALSAGAVEYTDCFSAEG